MTQHLPKSLLRLKDQIAPKQLALFAVPAALLAATAVAAYAVSRGATNGSAKERGPWLRRLVAGLDLDMARHETLGFVRDSIAGLDRNGVRGLLGDPAAVAEGGIVLADPPRPRQDVADLWYYRLDKTRDDAASLAVAFDAKDRAKDARFLLAQAT